MKYTLLIDKACEDCGAMMTQVGQRRQYCDSCLKRRKAEKRIQQRTNPKPEPTRERHHLPSYTMTIDDVVREAHEKGMSYGKYVAKFLLRR